MSSTPRLGRAALAAALAVVLLSGSGGTAASWSDSVTSAGSTISSGRLEVEAVSSSVLVTRPGSPTPTPLATTAVQPGDTITLTSTVRVRTAGDALDARLALDASAATLVVGGVDLSAGAHVGTSSSLPSAGTHSFAVTGSDDGATATATVAWTIPATTDGRPRAADRSNWWGTRLQNQSVAPGGLRWTLVQQS
ncbi:alternate-type signal peptide domain-containing protein [Georgenia sp. Z1344]|uniref:alternate-type signal peptide domain-containing protein n=1 Tax=Georgenia sp. Z1344 TaxID=3416706 RepID=UPI003CE6BAA7